VNTGTISVQGGLFAFEDGRGGDSSTGSFKGSSGTTMQICGGRLGPASSILSTGIVQLDGGLTAGGLFNVQTPGGTNVTGPGVQITGDLENLGAYLTLSSLGGIVLKPSSGPGKITIGVLTLSAGASLALGVKPKSPAASRSKSEN